MDKLKLTGQKPGRIFNFECGCVRLYIAIALITKQPHLKLETRPKPLLGSVSLAFALPGRAYQRTTLGIVKYSKKLARDK
jgi:hypothetical protein